MVSNTLSRVAGIAAFGLMVARLGRLFETGGEAPAWHLILLAAAFLGGVAWWLISQTMTSKRAGLWVFSVAGLLLSEQPVVVVAGRSAATLTLPGFG